MQTPEVHRRPITRRATGNASGRQREVAPGFNVQAARWIFLSALRLSNDYWKAIGIYHSPTEWRQRRYANSVAIKLRVRFGDDAFE